MLQRFVVLVLLFAVTLSVTSSVWAQGCAMCRTALEQSAEGRAIAGRFNYGILFLMGIPYAMFGAAGIAVFRAYRKRIRKIE